MRKIIPLATLCLLMAALLLASAPDKSARPEAEQKALAKIQQLGGLALELAQNDNRLEVSYLQHDQKFSDEFLAPLKDLTGLTNLEYLNVYGTAVTDVGLANLEGMKKLKNLYVWQTKVTEAGVGKL